jgi:hypothetical protein
MQPVPAWIKWCSVGDNVGTLTCCWMISWSRWEGKLGDVPCGRSRLVQVCSSASEYRCAREPPYFCIARGLYREGAPQECQRTLSEALFSLGSWLGVALGAAMGIATACLIDR